MPFTLNRRVVDSFQWEAGEERTIRLNRNDNVLHKIRIFVSGEWDASVGGSGLKMGGLANMIKNILLRIEAYDSAIGRQTSNDSRLNLPGYALAFAPSDAVSAQPRINFLNPSAPIWADNGMYRDVNSTLLSKQDFHFSLDIPFYQPRGRNPEDCSFDMANAAYVDLVLTMGKIGDIFQAANVAGVFDATVKIIVEEYRDVDLRVARGNNIFPQFVKRYNYEEFIVNASNNEFRQPIRMSRASIGALTFICIDDSDGSGDDSILKNIRIERDNNAHTDVPAQVLRNINIEQMSNYPPQANNNGKHPLSDSGVYIFAPQVPEFADRILQSRAVYTGAGDDASELVLDIEKPSAGNARIILLKEEIRMSNAMSAVSRAQDDQTQAQRQLSAESLAAAHARQRQVEAAARSL